MRVEAGITKERIEMAARAGKLRMYNDLWADRYGNHFLWVTLNEFWLDHRPNPQHNYSVRFGTHFGAPWEYELTRPTFQRLCATDWQNLDWDQLSVVIKPVGVYELLQGELMRSADKGLELFYSTIRKPIRFALAEGGQTITGPAVKVVLRSFADPSSIEDLMALLDQHPDAVIEFGVFSQDVGVIPHRNTVIWEVREY